MDELGTPSNAADNHVSADVTHGNVARVQNGNVYDQQTGDSTLDAVGNLNSFRTGYSNSLVEGAASAFTTGAELSTVGGVRVAAMVSGTIDLTGLLSAKTVFGWEVEISRSNQTHCTGPKVYEFEGTMTYQKDAEGHYELTDLSTLFAGKFSQFFAEWQQTVLAARINAERRIQNSEASVNMISIAGAATVTAGNFKVVAREEASLSLITRSASVMIRNEGATLRATEITVQLRPAAAQAPQIAVGGAARFSDELSTADGD